MISDEERGGRDRLGESMRDESGIIVFGGGGSGCGARGCLFWIVVSVILSVGLTILVNLILFLLSGPGSGVGV